MVDPYNTKITNYSLLFPLIQKKGNSLEPFPFQLICFISSEVCIHHMLPDFVSQCNVWFHCVIVFMSSVGHHQLWRPSLENPQ